MVKTIDYNSIDSLTTDKELIEYIKALLDNDITMFYYSKDETTIMGHFIADLNHGIVCSMERAMPFIHKG